MLEHGVQDMHGLADAMTEALGLEGGASDVLQLPGAAPAGNLPAELSTAISGSPSLSSGRGHTAVPVPPTHF